jgi:outer membrane protein OmpA-like peptidoglycan-associated protein
VLPGTVRKGDFVKSLSHLTAAGLLVALASGCASTGNTMKESRGALLHAYKTGEDSKIAQPWICAVAGALVAGGLASTENKESAAIGAVVGGGLGWWACRSMEKPLPDADQDGVPDKVDVCPGTPAGTRVTANGCDVNVDTDGDGVPDRNDKCAATSKGAEVDAAGCVVNIDADGDGVPDAADLCGNTSAGAKVLANGCEEDTDADGVPDSIDRCAGTPREVKVGLDGCALDADGDGVPDVLDRCPNTKSGAKVDGNGCESAAPAAKAAVPITDRMVLKGVNFESGSAKITRESFTALDDVAAQLKANPATKVEIAGFTDNSGSAQLNRALSQRRAEMVMSYLVARGVPAASLVAKGYGPDQPIADNASDDGRAQNRRVELRLIGN